MSADPGKLTRFWQELKRRRVIKVIAMYAATAYIILEASDIILPRLGLPDWTVTFLLVLIIVGFPITVILSWIFDVTPQGVRKTESMEEIAAEVPGQEPGQGQEEGPGQAARPGHGPTAAITRTKKIFSPSNIIIALLLVVVCILLYPKIFKQDRLSELRDEEGMISLAVLPFDNLTGDSSLYYWQNGISEYLINSLGNSDQLAVSSSQVVSDVLESTQRQVNTSSLSPEIARKTASRINASTYITGNFIGKENNANIMLNLVDTEKGELIWSTRVNGDLGMDYQAVLDHLSDTVRNYMEIKALEEQVESDLTHAYPKSAEAYRYYIDGLNALLDGQYEIAKASLKEAYDIDTTFTFAAFYMAFAHCFGGPFNEDMVSWIRRAHELKDNLPPVYRPWIDMWYACFLTEDYDDVERYCDMMYDAALHSRLLFFDLAVTYTSFFENYAKSIQAFQKIEALNEQWEDDWRFQRYYHEYSLALLLAERPEEAMRIIEKGLELNPDNGSLMISRSGAYLMMGDSTAAEQRMEQYRDRVKERGWTEAVAERGIGLMYTRARDSLSAIPYFRKAYELNPDQFNNLSALIWCQLHSDINTEECLHLAQFGHEKWPDRFMFPLAMGVSLYKLGRYEEALTFFRKVDDEYLEGSARTNGYIRELEQKLALQEQ